MRAVLLLGHGSRFPEASQDMEQVASRLRALGLYGRVEVCHMSLCAPSLPEGIDRCVTAGAGAIVVMPYFLHAGVHLKEDIPRLIAACAKEHPGVSIRLAPHLGFDETLADLVRRRIAECPG